MSGFFDNELDAGFIAPDDNKKSEKRRSKFAPKLPAENCPWCHKLYDGRDCSAASLVWSKDGHLRCYFDDKVKA